MMNTRRLALAALVVLGCKKSPPATATDAATGTRAATPAPTADAPENLLLTLRGASLRRALPLILAQSGSSEIVEQISRQITPGVADHGDEVDVDSPFAVAGIVGGAQESTLDLYVAWPLKPGMQVTQAARALRGYRAAAEGLYAPTARDAGADAEQQCWVAQRPPVGWMLVCGPREGLPRVAGYLRAKAASAPDNAAVVDLELRAAIARRLSSRQLAELDRHAPPPGAGSPVELAQRAMFDQARRTLQRFNAVVNDVDTLHGAVTQDENAMHLRAELSMPRASSETTRAMIAAAAGKQAPAGLLALLPAAVQSWVVGGFDREQILTAFGGPEAEAGMAQQFGPELSRVMTMVNELKSLTPLGTRIDGFSLEDGYTMYHVVTRPDAVQFVSDLRVALNSVPARPLPEGGTLRDVATSLPTTGLTGVNAVRVGRNVHIPPGVRVPPEVRAMIERSMLLVAEGDRLIAVMGRDPIARYRAMSQGARLAATVAPGAAMAGRITAAALPSLLLGNQIPGMPESHSTEGADFALKVERRGEGARVELRADAPISAATELRQTFAMIQEAQAQMMRQMMEQQRRAAQGGAGAPGGPGAMPRGPAPRAQRPQLDPSNLPEPPQLQLQPPR